MRVFEPVIAIRKAGMEVLTQCPLQVLGYSGGLTQSRASPLAFLLPFWLRVKRLIFNLLMMINLEEAAYCPYTFQRLEGYGRIKNTNSIY